LSGCVGGGGTDPAADSEDFRTAAAFDYRDVGSTTVPEPDWLDEAREETSG
jgi:hypothetical protein